VVHEEKSISYAWTEFALFLIRRNPYLFKKGIYIFLHID